jgi:hypothetical protein
MWLREKKMNYIEHGIQNKVARFESSMDELSTKLSKPAMRVHTIKKRVQSINWSYVAIALGLIAVAMIYRSKKKSGMAH